ncbi:MAG: class I SAM-dependent methyltransferase [Rhodocyclaceae bacterium]|nr:MAG: class I SAM-dependent methyltransferase [Rhodocyclaceae bacterium]
MTPLLELLDAGRAYRFPDRLTDIESWHQHIPFAFALIGLARPALLVELGTHKGDSYSAFCQAIAVEGLSTRACAVDTWCGDEHSGAYSGSVFDDFQRYHDPRYAAFSTLMRMSFDDALSSFADGSIDLLHIDGMHTEAAVRHDFDTWLPKLSPRGIVLFHDTTVRERDFGVWKVWEDVKDRHPSFGFEHGHGLGMLLVGSAPAPALLALCRLDDGARRQVADLFAALGARIQHARREQVLGATAGELREQLADARARYAELLVANTEGDSQPQAFNAGSGS